MYLGECTCDASMVVSMCTCDTSMGMYFMVNLSTYYMCVRACPYLICVWVMCVGIYSVLQE